ncbi:protein US31 [macacine betaherpesvirus 3]|uniref:Rh225 n=1 Tax=Rhesus cytomegalovirus (strain 68-1) TaxID=47929 RepID=Q7TFB9_RHCM6|nr:rh225 [macacine betaherpesvirus 3]AAP50745.1 rh225 [macacine betaherpesvirus 3]QMS44146.1 Rh225 [synthetic construct]QQL10683.1 Rh225 [Rhesus cytomegalovirus strain 68-1.2]QQL10867.1 Rh225 [Rhesus cytomegalovirus strain 68-1_FL]AFL03556.1 Rh225 [macacine betaherpesvirus 3]
MEKEETWRGLMVYSHSLWCICGHWKAHIIMSDEANSEEVACSNWMEDATMRWIRNARETHDKWCRCTDWRGHALSLDENRISLVTLPAAMETKSSTSRHNSRLSCFTRVFKSFRKKGRCGRGSGTASNSSGASTISSHSWQWYRVTPPTPRQAECQRAPHP